MLNLCGPSGRFSKRTLSSPHDFSCSFPVQWAGDRHGQPLAKRMKDMQHRINRAFGSKVVDRALGGITSRLCSKYRIAFVGCLKVAYSLRRTSRCVHASSFQCVESASLALYTKPPKLDVECSVVAISKILDRRYTLH